MAYFFGTTAFGSTGVQTISLGFQPTAVHVTVGQKFGTAQNFAHSSRGATDGTNQEVNTFFQDTTGGKTVTDDNKLISHYERVGGVITEVLSGALDSFTTTAVKINITTANANYNVLIEAWG